MYQRNRKYCTLYAHGYQGNNVSDRRKVYFESKFKRCLTNCEKNNSRQVFVVLYERFENVLICIIYVGSVGPFRPISNFPFFLPK